MSYKFRQPKSENGFTIIELMIATTVFTVVLLLCTFTILQIGRVYYKGITSSQTQNRSRAAVDDVSQAIQYSSGDVNTTESNTQRGKLYCAQIGNKRYVYELGMQLKDNVTDASKQSTHVLTWEQTNDGCPPPDSVSWPTSNYTELVGQNMSLAKFYINKIYAGYRLYSVSARIVYGDDDLQTDLLTYSDPTTMPDGIAGTDGIKDSCTSGAGSQFCAVSDLTTNVEKRHQ